MNIQITWINKFQYMKWPIKMANVVVRVSTNFWCYSWTFQQGYSLIILLDYWYPWLFSERHKPETHLPASPTSTNVAVDLLCTHCPGGQSMYRWCVSGCAQVQIYCLARVREDQHVQVSLDIKSLHYAAWLHTCGWSSTYVGHCCTKGALWLLEIPE